MMGGALSSWESQSIRLPHDSFSGFDTKIHLSDAPPDHLSADVKVSNFTKDELNAKLAQNKAEVDSVAAGMKTEMANFRTAYVESFSEISKTLSRIEAKADATEKTTDSSSVDCFPGDQYLRRNLICCHIFLEQKCSTVTIRITIWLANPPQRLNRVTRAVMTPFPPSLIDPATVPVFTALLFPQHQHVQCQPHSQTTPTKNKT
ncbi:Uncharacterised protein [Klebsiella pneumoniae]|uniref:Uncharacterized protein n=1 Tax=Klebsiella pneumoniae TaxID=573 RepID=A0A377XRS8_KLEPN|nr:Uncharacterised protein [Klebsiella pneumoniae]